MSKILVFAEQRDSELKKTAFENISLAHKLSQKAGLEFITVVIGHNLSGVENELAKYGATKVYAYSNEKLALYNAEAYAKILADAVKEHDAGIILMGSTAMGRDLAPRVAARLDASLASDATDVDWVDGQLLVVRPMYAGKVRVTIRLHSEIKMVTVRPNVFLAEENPASAQFSENPVDPGELRAVVSEIIRGAEEKLDVTEADIIVSGGRGLKGPENFEMITTLAKKLGAAQGASRAVVDAGWRPYEEQVGQTGKTVSPSLYIAVAISGAIQHLAGMSSSKYIVAINKDPEAPIFKVADYGIVGDAFEVVPKLIEVLS